MEIYRPPFKYIYKMMKDIKYLDEIKESCHQLYWVTERWLMTYSSYLPEQEAIYWSRDEMTKQFILLMIETNPSMLEKLEGMTPIEFIRRGKYAERGKLALVIFNPDGTKIVLRRCKRSGKYTFPTKRVLTSYSQSDGAELARKTFEKTTKLCSCSHLEHQTPCNVDLKRWSVDIYFACGVPEDTPFYTPNFFDPCVFVEIDAITATDRYTPTEYAEIIIKSLLHIRRHQNKTVSPTEVCDMCVTSQKANNEGKFDAVTEERLKIVMIGCEADGVWLKKPSADAADSGYGFAKGEIPESSDKVEELIKRRVGEKFGTVKFTIDTGNVIVRLYNMYFVIMENGAQLTDVDGDELKYFKFNQISDDGCHGDCDVSFEVMAHLERIKKYCRARGPKITNSVLVQPETNSDGMMYGAIILDPTFTKLVLTRGQDKEFNFPLAAPYSFETPNETTRRAAMEVLGLEHYISPTQVSDHPPIEVPSGGIPYSLLFVLGAGDVLASASGGDVKWFEVSRVLTKSRPKFSDLVKACLPEVKMFCNENKMADVSVVGGL